MRGKKRPAGHSVEETPLCDCLPGPTGGVRPWRVEMEAPGLADHGRRASFTQDVGRPSTDGKDCGDAATGGKDIRMLENTIGRIEQELPTSPDRLGDCAEAHKQLLEALIRLEKYLYTAHRQLLHVEGDKAGVMLARSLKQETSHTPILSITDAKGRIVYSQEAINDVFCLHLGTCYVPPPLISASDIEAYLMRVTLPVLSSEARETLDHPLTKEKFASVISLLKTLKTLGNNGFPVEVYH
ncbi:hypothetical protein NDU88_004629 [Pleurodeles waltl]|uniref:Uncharacterized protein n=1 Tax=Pleurodeles waltl TaxID=8319 RepID=A0AAV7RM45_PLEWA|nr:hypothetical protein NDU88_004629 [Pleurodeles waltl]